MHATLYLNITININININNIFDLFYLTGVILLYTYEEETIETCDYFFYLTSFSLKKYMVMVMVYTYKQKIWNDMKGNLNMQWELEVLIDLDLHGYSLTCIWL